MAVTLRKGWQEESKCKDDGANGYNESCRSRQLAKLICATLLARFIFPSAVKDAM